MEKRVLVTVALSIAVLVGYQLIQAKFFPTPPPPVSTAVAPGAPSGSPAPGAPPAPSGASAPTPTPGAPAAAAPGALRVAEERETVERPGFYRAVFSSWGGTPVELSLLHPQFKEERAGAVVPIQLTHPQAGPAPLFAVTFQGSGADAERSDFDLPADAVWTRQKGLEKGPEELVYAADVGGVHLEKRWTLPARGYQIGLALTVENRGDKPVTHRLLATMAGWQDPAVKPGGWLSFGRRENLTDAACLVGGKVKRQLLEEAIEKPIAEVGDLRWIAIGQPFFVAALGLAKETEGRACQVRGEAGGRMVARAVFPARTVPPGQKQVVSFAGFVGPKLLHELDDVAVGGESVGLGDAVDYTFAWLARPMFWVLKVIQRGVVNWGVAIIVITLLLKLVMFWPTHKSMQSAKAMARLKPELDKLKERLGDDKEAFSQAQMKLFKERGVNPLGGCLPMLLQMPIYIAFYSMLSNAVELYRAPFFGPINDMTAPFWPMALATGVLMFVQQKISPAVPDSQQQQIMMYMMPVMFTMFTLMLPSGLVLYILTNTLLTMGQQWWMNRHDPPLPTKAPAAKPTKPAKA